MSSSSKKKLRKEQEAAALTEKQRTQQQEAKKLKRMTTVFVVILALVLCSAIVTLSIRAYNNSGITERNTVALTIGEHQLNAAEFNYYYLDAINSLYTSVSAYGSYASTYAQALYGVDLTLPLDQQIYNEEDGTTWADYFIQLAESNATSVYAIYDEAVANGFTLSEEEQAALDTQIDNIHSMAKDSYGFSNLKSYLKAMYGNGATEESYLAYFTTNTVASAYSSSYKNSIEYTDAELREYEADKAAEYSSYSYASYYVSRSDYLTGGTTDDEGNTTYTDAEIAAIDAKTEEVASGLAESATSIEALNEAIAALEVNADAEGEITADEYTDVLYSSITTYMRDWITDEARVEGDTTIIANTTETTEDDGSTSTRLNGYYVLYFIGTNDNTYPLVNVRHVLVDFEGGTTDENGNVTYTDDEKAATMASAEALLDQWKAGEATEESFAALANEKSTDPGSNTNGGLYEDIYPGEMLDAFNDWCFDESRQPGDTGVIQTTAGCHLMYFSGDSDTTYRDYMITNEMLTADINEWQTALVEGIEVAQGDLSLINTSLVVLS